MRGPLRICLVASMRHPIAEPFAGGLESFTHALASQLVRRGHHVDVFAAPGSDAALGVRPLDVHRCELSPAAMADVNAPTRTWMEEHHAYLGLMLELAAPDAPYDVVHNNSLHHLPLAMARTLRAPMVSTLHTPPVPWLESALALAPDASTFAAVSRSTRDAWRHVVDSTVVPNGVDTDAWRAGPGGGPAVWTGRLVPEKAPHLAIAACRAAGVPLVLAGPVGDAAYWESEVRPLLGAGVTYAGHLDRASLVRLVGRASVALVTPAWEEPYGLVAAEAMSCGTPVAGLRRGALPEVVPAGAGVLVAPDDVEALAAAVLAARDLDREQVRAHAVAHCSLHQMVEAYERLYEDLLGERAAA